MKEFQAKRQDRKDVAFEKSDDIEGSSSQATENLVGCNSTRISDIIARLIRFTRDQHCVEASGEGNRKESSLVGLFNTSIHKAQEVISPLKPNIEIVNPSKKPATPLSLNKGDQSKEKAK